MGMGDSVDFTLKKNHRLNGVDRQTDGLSDFSDCPILGLLFIWVCLVSI